MGNSASKHFIASIPLIALVTACSEEPRPPTAMEFMENPVLLDATIVRCVENREDLRYEPECINARDAVDLIAVKAEKARRAELEAESARKREALRRAQEATDEAKRRAAEAERLRKEAELLGLVVPVPDDTAASPETVPPVGEAAPTPVADELPAETESPPETESPAEIDLEGVREELQQRHEEPPPPPAGQQPVE